MRGVAVLRCGPAAADRLPGVLTSFPVGRRHSACHVQVAGSCCQVACFTGAVVLSRNQVRCSGQEYPLAQQVGFRTSVHRRLELLDAVDGALDGTGVVGVLVTVLSPAPIRRGLRPRSSHCWLAGALDGPLDGALDGGSAYGLLAGAAVRMLRRAVTSSLTSPYGSMCCQNSGVSPRRSSDVSSSVQSGSARTSWSCLLYTSPSPRDG